MKTIRYYVCGRYEDGTEDVFETFLNYEDAEKYLIGMSYDAEEFYIRKVWVNK